MHEIEQVNVIQVLAEVFADHLEDCTFQKEHIVHSHKANALYGP
jgi:hypothetical protein